MPNWKKLIVSGSDAILKSVTASFTGSLTGSLFGTASWARNALTASAGGSNTQIQFNSASRFLGDSSFTFNYQSQSLQQGNSTTATGLYSHAEGESTQAIGSYSHAEGTSTIASGSYSHAEGSGQAIGNYSHAEGGGQALGNYSHAEGDGAAIGVASHAEGRDTIAIGDFSHAEGQNTYPGARGYYSVDAGATTPGELKLDSVYGNITSSFTGFPLIVFDDTTYNNSYGRILIAAVSSIFNGTNTVVSSSLAVSTPSGADIYLIGSNAFYNAPGADKLLGDYSHAEGVSTQAIGNHSHAEGNSTQAIGNYSHAEGESTQAIGTYSHAEGYSTQAIGLGSHAEGFSTIASGSYSHAEGELTQAIGDYSHAEGAGNYAIGFYSHAEGYSTQAIGDYSHAEGRGTQAVGYSSHAEGDSTQAIGDYSHAEGYYTVASGAYQHVQGQYNISSSAQSAFIIGNGTADNARSNLVFASGSQFQITGSLQVSGSITGSLFGTASWATNALTASSVTTLNQSVLVTGSLTVGATSLGANENTLILGPAPAGGTGEGGQLLLQAPGGTYTSASMWDNYQNQTRLLRGTNAGSDAVVAQFNMHTKQVSFPQYNNVSSFPGSAAAFLAVDSSGNIITTSSAGGGGGSTTINNNTDNYVITGTGTLNTLNGEANLQFDGSKLTVTGQITASGAIISTANNQMYFRGGDDAEFWDINVANTVGIYGQQNADRAGLKLGSGGPTLFGSASNLGIGTITPNSGTLHVAGGVFATSFTGSLQGTSSWAINALTASYLLGGSSGTPGGANKTIQFNGAGTFSGSNNFTFNSASNQVQLTGSLIIKSSSVGGIDTLNSYLYDNSNNLVVNWNGYSLIQPTTQVSTLDWSAGLLRDPSTDEVAIDWDSRILQDEGAVIALTFSDVNVSNGVRLYGTSSFAITASYALSSPGGTGDTTSVEAQFWFLL